MHENAPTVRLPQIPDHEIIRPIGRGACGEVWLARSVTGSWRAAKVTYRNTFSEDRPFFREFEGIQKFEPISRSHSGFVSILHVGRNLAADYFYCVMELADDIRSGQEIDPETYVARTLRKEMSDRGRLPAPEVLELSLALASAIQHLHSQGLIHRDIKPSNIIFVNSVPKFADIGLVTEVGEGVTAVGTPGYMPPEGPGGAQGDIYSLGKVFYELTTGNHCKHFPELPLPLSEFVADPSLARMNTLVLKACHSDTSQRFQTAEELYQALLELKGSSRAAPSPKAVIGSGTSLTKAPGGDDRKRPVVCFIDDDEEELEIFHQVFDSDLQIVGGTRFNDALPTLRALAVPPDLIVLDLYFPLGREATHEERETMRRMRSEVDTVLKKLSDYCKGIGQDREGGLRLLEQVRREFKTVPVVFYTRKGTVDDVAACLEAGAQEVIRKPQPETIDVQRELYPQLVEATMAHRSSLLNKFESLALKRSLFGKLMRVASYVRKNWSRI